MKVAFKEWFAVCEAIGKGEQDVLIRKGGIHEGRDGFRFKHEEFYLFPTLFHKQSTLLLGSARADFPDPSKRVWEVGDVVPVKYKCRVTAVEDVRDWQQVLALSGRHIYSEELLRERFLWSGKGMDEGSVQVAQISVELLDPALEVAYSKAQGGCRSWVTIP